jgi:hypothetical protein
LCLQKKRKRLLTMMSFSRGHDSELERTSKAACKTF